MSEIFNIKKLLRLVRGESGTEIVEFAAASSVLVLVLFGVFQCGFAMYAYHFTTYAAQQGTRFAMVRGYTWSQDSTTSCSTSAPPSFAMAYDCTASATDIQNYVQSLAGAGIKASGVTINTTSSYVWPGTTPDGGSCSTVNSKGCMVKVTVKYTYNMVPFIPMTGVPMSATSEKVILQ
jgi:Flp pilus assembly protein TadG